MTDQRGLPFMDAIKELAAQAGMEVPRPDPVAAQRAEKRASLVDVTEAAQRWFVEMLGSPDGARARDYLASRGFSPQIIREFGFGYAPDSKVALKGALSDFGEGMLVESGITVICAGGGGIPVAYDDKRKLFGVEAVIDKDLALQEANQIQRILVAVVDALEHHIFERDPFGIRQARILPAGIEQGFDVPFLVDRNQNVAQIVANRMQGNCQHAADLVAGAEDFRHDAGSR